jgi:hypothetical protein
MIRRRRYHEIKDEWFGKPEVFDRQDVIEVLRASCVVLWAIDSTAVTGTSPNRC